MSPVELGLFRSNDDGSTSRSWQDLDRSAYGYIKAPENSSLLEIEYSLPGHLGVEVVPTVDSQESWMAVFNTRIGAKVVEELIDRLD